MSIGLRRGLQRQIQNSKRSNKKSSPFLSGNVSSRSNNKNFHYLNQKYDNSFNSKDKVTIMKKSNQSFMSKQQLAYAQNELMPCRYLINLIEDEVNLVNQNNTQIYSSKNSDSQKVLNDIQQNVESFLREYKKIANKKKVEFMFRLISCLAVLKNRGFIKWISLQEIKSTIAYLNQKFQSLMIVSTGQKLKLKDQQQCQIESHNENKKDQQQHELQSHNQSKNHHQSSFYSFTQRTRLSPSQDKLFLQTNRVTQASQRSKNKGNFTLSSGKRSLSKSKLTNQSLHNLGSTSRGSLNQQSSNRQQQNLSLSTKLKQIMELITMSRVDYVLNLVFPHHDKQQLSPYQKLLEDRVFVDSCLKILQFFKFPIIERKLQLYYSEQEFLSFSQNCKSLLDFISSIKNERIDSSNTNQYENKQQIHSKQTDRFKFNNYYLNPNYTYPNSQLSHHQYQSQKPTQNDDITTLKAQIYQLIGQQLFVNPSDQLNLQLNQSHSIVSTAKFTSTHNNDHNKLSRHSYVKNTTVSQNQSQNFLSLQQSKRLTIRKKPSIQSNGHQSSASSRHSQSQQFIKLDNKQLLEYRYSIASSKQARSQNSAIIISPPKKTKKLNRKSSNTHSHSQFNSNNDCLSGDKQITITNNQFYQQKNKNQKSTKKILRRSGIISHNKQKQSSTKRISTRWNNLQNIPLIDMIHQSKQHAQRIRSKIKLKTQFSFKEQNKTQLLNQQNDSNYSSNQSQNSYAKQKSFRSIEISHADHNAGQNYQQIHNKIISFSNILIQSSKRNFSQKQANIILNHNFQGTQIKLSYIRLMTLLSFNFSSLIYCFQLKNQLRKKQNRLFPRVYNNFNDRKKTFYEEKYLIQKSFRNNNMAINVFDFDGSISLMRQKKISNKYQRLQQEQERVYISSEIFLNKILKSYLNFKEKRIQDKLTQCSAQKFVEGSLKSSNTFDLKRFSKELLIKPFIIHLDKATKVGNEDESQVQIIGFSKVQFEVSGNCKGLRKVVERKQKKKCTEVSLKYQRQNQGESKIVEDNFSLKQAKGSKNSLVSLQIGDSGSKGWSRNETNQSKDLSVQNKKWQQLQMGREDAEIEILQIPLSIVVRSTQDVREIIAEEIELMVTLRTRRKIRPCGDDGQLEQRTYDKKRQRNQLKRNYNKDLFQSQQRLQDDSDQSSFNNTSLDSQSFSFSDSQQMQQDNKHKISNRFNNKQRISQYSNSIPESDSSSEQSQSNNNQLSMLSLLSEQFLQDNPFQSNQPHVNTANFHSKHYAQQSPAPSINSVIQIQSVNGGQSAKCNNNKYKNSSSSSSMNYIKTNLVHDFYSSYFHIQTHIQFLLSNFLQLNQSDLGVQLEASKQKYLHTTFLHSSFIVNRNKLSVSKNVRLLKVSPILKSLLSSVPNELAKLEILLNKDYARNKNKNSCDFIDLELQIKIQKQSALQNLSEKKVMLEKFTASTSHKTMLNLNTQKVIKSFQSIKIIKKVNSFFFFKTSLLLVQNINELSQILSDNFKVFQIQETYCQNFHELYEKQVYPLNAVKEIVHNLSPQKGQNSQLFLKLVIFLESKFCKILKSPTLDILKSLSNKKSHSKSTGLQNNFKLILDFIKKNRHNVFNRGNWSHFQKQDTHERQQKIYKIKIREIADNLSKTQDADVQIIEHFTEHEKSQDLFWIGYDQINLRNKRNHSKIDKSHKIQRGLFSMHNTQDLGSFKIFDQVQADLRNEPNKSKKNVDQLCFPCIPNAFEKKSARKNTGETNKNQEFYEVQGKVPTIKVLHTPARKSKRNITFTPTPKQYPLASNEYLFSQKTESDFYQSTQKSFKSHQSKSRLQRHAHHMTSLIPTSGKVLQSIKNIQSSMFDKKCLKKSLLPSLKPYLSTYNNLSRRKSTHWKSSKRLHHTDNFINFNEKQLDEKFDEKTLKQNNTAQMQTSSNRISLIKKQRFYQKKGLSFATLIKRLGKYIICLVQSQQTNELQTQVQVFAGLYQKNLSLIKIISGKILTQIFGYIISSHQQLQIYINCQLSTSFEINNTPLKKIYLSFNVKQKLPLALKQLGTEQQCLQGKIRPKLGIQKYVKTKLLTRFILGLRRSEHIFQEDVKHGDAYCLVSIFAYVDLPNQDICIHVYLPKNSKNIMFMVEGDVAFDYMCQLVHTTLAQKFILQNFKSKFIEKMNTNKLNDSGKKLKPRLSIFTSPSQSFYPNPQTKRSSPTRNKLKNIDSKYSNFKTNSIQSTSKRNLSLKNQTIFTNPTKKIRDWSNLFIEFQKVKKQIKFNHYFTFQPHDNQYFLHFTNLPTVHYKGVQVLRKRIHAKIYMDSTNTNIFQIKPKALQIVSISYEEKSLALLSFFTPETFCKVRINQRYIKFVNKFENAIHFNENLQDTLQRQRQSTSCHQTQMKKNYFRQRSSQSNQLINKIKFNGLYYLPLTKPVKLFNKEENSIQKYKQFLMEG